MQRQLWCHSGRPKTGRTLDNDNMEHVQWRRSVVKGVYAKFPSFLLFPSLVIPFPFLSLPFSLPLPFPFPLPSFPSLRPPLSQLEGLGRAKVEFGAF